MASLSLNDVILSLTSVPTFGVTTIKQYKGCDVTEVQSAHDNMLSDLAHSLHNDRKYLHCLWGHYVLMRDISMSFILLMSISL